MAHPLTTSRRTLLALVGASALGATAACDSGTGGGRRAGAAGRGAVDPDQRLLDTAVSQCKVLRERVLQTVRQHPGTEVELSGVLTCLEAHLGALGEDDLPGPDRPTPGSPTGSPTQQGTPPQTPAAHEVPDDRDEALAAVVSSLTSHTEALVDFSARAESGSFARLLAVMAAGCTQFRTTLQKAG